MLGPVEWFFILVVVSILVGAAFGAWKGARWLYRRFIA